MKHKVASFSAQAVSSLTNFLPGMFAAHVLSLRQFGIFALIQFGYMLVVGGLRSYCTDPAALSPASDLPTRRHLGAIDSVGVVAILVAFIYALIAVFLGKIDLWVLLLALGMVAVMLQDCVRYIAIALGHGEQALLNDSIWLFSIACLLPLFLFALDPSPFAVASAWTLASIPGLIYGCLKLGWRPRVSRGLWYLRTDRSLSASFFVEWLLRAGVSIVGPYAMGSVGGLSSIAYIRAAQLLLGPLNIAFGGVQFALTRSILTLRETNLEAMALALKKLSWLLGLLPVVLVAALLILPVSVLSLATGAKAANGLDDYLIPLGVALSVAGLTSGPGLGLRMLRAKRALTVARAVSTAAIALGGLAGLHTSHGALGGLWGLAIGSVITVPLWSLQLRQSLMVERSSLAVSNEG